MFHTASFPTNFPPQQTQQHKGPEHIHTASATPRCPEPISHSSCQTLVTSGAFRKAARAARPLDPWRRRLTEGVNAVVVIRLRSLLELPVESAKAGGGGFIGATDWGGEGEGGVGSVICFDVTLPVTIFGKCIAARRVLVYLCLCRLSCAR